MEANRSRAVGYRPKPARPLVELYVRQGEICVFRAFSAMEEVLPLLDGKVRIRLSEIYDRVKFPQARAKQTGAEQTGAEQTG